MSKNQRHTIILETLKNAKQPISATSLATTTNVSRQLIVGDIALLRAAGHHIAANHMGYILNPHHLKHSKQIVFKHTPEQTRLELETLVKYNCKVVNVIIEHPSYGSLTGELNIETLDDVNAFVEQKHPLISVLTDGVHIHTIEYDDPKDLEAAMIELKQHNLIYV